MKQKDKIIDFIYWLIFLELFCNGLLFSIVYAVHGNAVFIITKFTFSVLVLFQIGIVCASIYLALEEYQSDDERVPECKRNKYENI